MAPDATVQLHNMSQSILLSIPVYEPVAAVSRQTSSYTHTLRRSIETHAQGALSRRSLCPAILNVCMLFCDPDLALQRVASS